MDFSWSPEQQELRDAILDFGRRSLRDDLIRRDREKEFSRELWNRCAEFGIQGLPFPAEYGGSDLDALTTVLAMEALGEACADNGLLFGINAQMWSVQMPIHRHGSEAQRRRYLPLLCGGEWIGAHGMSEPDSGSDAFALRTTARRDGDAYVLNGTKTFVSEAPIADLSSSSPPWTRRSVPWGSPAFWSSGIRRVSGWGSRSRKWGSAPLPWRS